MTTNDYIVPMSISKRVIFVTYVGAELLDLSGPATVFNAATLLDHNACYECIPCSAAGGPIEHSGGLTLETRSLSSIELQTTDTVLIIGGLRQAVEEAIKSESIIAALKRASLIVERYGSICSGSTVLHAAGLIEGKRFTTHWAEHRRGRDAQQNPISNEDGLYIKDGRLWTSAGVTTGIDMALSMVEEDHGGLLKARVAKYLVVYSHRPGNQSQFSQVLNAQVRVEQHFTGLVEWVMRRLDRPPKVEEMAKFVGMSRRSFYRKFTELLEMPPGKFIERLRLDHARHLIEVGEMGKSVAPRVGYRSVAAFRTAFKGAFGVTPRHYASMNRQ